MHLHISANVGIPSVAYTKHRGQRCTRNSVADTVHSLASDDRRSPAHGTRTARNISVHPHIRNDTRRPYLNEVTGANEHAAGLLEHIHEVLELDFPQRKAAAGASRRSVCD